jgi:putative membrane protein insertion efficiency factor
VSYAGAAAERLFSIYKRAISPALHSFSLGGCRFQPTCSEYATLAVAHHGWLRGGVLSLGRLLRCHPGCRGGFDPVPGTWHTPPASPAVQSSPAPVTIDQRHFTGPPSPDRSS